MDVIRHTHSAPGAMLSAPTDSKLVLRLGRNGDLATALLVFKAMVGVGLFALPYAFKTVGIGGGIISMAVAGLLCAYTNALLIRIKNVVARDTFRKHLNYVSLVEHCFGRWGGNVVLFLIVFTTLGGTAGTSFPGVSGRASCRKHLTRRLNGSYAYYYTVHLSACLPLRRP